MARARASFWLHAHGCVYSFLFFDLLFLRPCARLRVCGVLVVLVVSCGSEHGTSLVGVRAITGVPIYGVAGACWCFWTGRVDLTASFF